VQDGKRSSRAWPAVRQIQIVAGLAILAGLTILLIAILGAGSGLSQTATRPLPKFLPSGQQRASLQIQTVPTRVFHTEIVTDGYVAANGGYAAPGLASEGKITRGLPFLASQSGDVLQAESDLVTAKAQVRIAQTNEKRQRALYNTGGGALKDWQQAQVDLVTATAAIASARNRLRVQGKTGLEIAAFEEGQPRAANAVFSVGDLSTVWLIANVREADGWLIQPGDQVEVRVPAVPGEVFHAAITYIASTIDPLTHRLVVGAAIHNASGKLKPNMQATFTILAGQASQAPALPQNAVIYEGDLARVWVARPDGTFALRAVTVGRINSGYAEITKGLSAGERVVTAGALFLDQAAAGG